jgi:serine/threonine protein phosphatase PrpC
MLKKRKLQPLSHEKLKHAYKTKAGSNGNQTKINQDAIVIDTKLLHGLKMFCVCDGHGLNGHLVSAFIRTQLISTRLIKTYKRKSKQTDETGQRQAGREGVS